MTGTRHHGVESPEGRFAAFANPPLDVAIAGTALAASWVIALQRPVPAWELTITEWINGVPDAIAVALWPVMQVGSLAGPFLVAAAIAATRRDLGLAAATVAGGVASWFTAKLVKRAVQRERPATYSEVIEVRDGSAEGLGYLSGHSAVAATVAVMAICALPPRWRLLAPVAAGLVGIARIVFGAHPPADVVGGWSFGLLIGFATLAVLDRAERRAVRPAAETVNA